MKCDYINFCSAYYNSEVCNVKYIECLLYKFRKSLAEVGLSDKFIVKRSIKDLTEEINDRRKIQYR